VTTDIDPVRPRPDPTRIAALRRTGLLDTPPEEAFDRLTRLAATALGAPIAAMILVDEHRHFVKSSFGSPPSSASLSCQPLCEEVVASQMPLVVEDAREHPLGRGDVRGGEPGVVAYAGVPLVTPHGQALGCLCAVDLRPRAFSDRDVDVLADLAAAAGTEIERRRAEDELRRREQHLRSIIETTPECVKLIAADGTLLAMNPAGLSMVEARREEDVLGQCLYPVIAPEHRDAFRAFNEQVCQGHRGSLEFDIVGLAGTRRSMQTQAVPLQDPDRGRVHLAITRDVTQQKRTGEALKNRAAQLADADRRKDEFLAMLGHELRNPLAPIRNALHVLRSPRAQGAQIERAKDMLDRQVDQLVRLVDDLLDVSRVTRGKIQLRRERLGLSKVIGSAVETARPLIDALGHELTVCLPEEPVYVEGDAVRLTQVLANLLNNAAKYTERGGHVELSAAVEGGTAVVRVRDDGIGIGADLLPHVFDMFVQAERSMARSQGGMGIGLTLVRHLVELHGGSVQAFSAGPDQGCEMVVRLPAARREERGALAVAEGGPASGAGLRVLVVDDNADVADSLAMLLELSSHEVRAVYSGADALDALAVFRPDVVLLDIGLPTMTGYEVVRRIRGCEEGRRALVVAVTGYGQPEDRRLSLEAGFDHHLVKPVDLDALLALLGGSGRDAAARSPRP
jgi:two-component system CheB/CheR fusion protein